MSLGTEQQNFQFLTRYVALILADGKDIERSIQVACGAVFIALLNLIVGHFELSDPLRPAIGVGLSHFGSAFVFALIGTAARALQFDIHRSVRATDTRIPGIVFAIAWSAAIILAVGFMIGGGYKLVMDIGLAPFGSH